MTTAAASAALARARDIVPVLAAHAAAGRANHRMNVESIEAMQGAGLFRLLLPRRLGGDEADPRALYEAEMILGEGDMSAAWILGVSGVISWLIGLFDAKAGDDARSGRADPVFCCAFRRTGTATPVAGGYRLSGRWSYASGCQHSDWAVLGGLREGAKPGPEDHLLLLAPLASLEIVETWRPPGLQATGSHDVVAREAFVPGHRVIRLIDNLHCVGPGQSAHPSPVYRMPFGQIFGAGVSVAAVGALQAMLDAFVKVARERKRVGASLSDDPDAQMACAEAFGAIDIAKLIVTRNFGDMLRDAERGEVTQVAARIRYKYQFSTITERCRAAAMKIADLAGTAGLSGDAPFPRLLADISAGRQHITNQVVLHGRDVGHDMLGLPEKLDFML